MKVLKLLLIAVLLAGVGLNGCVRNPVTGKKQISLMSEEQEKAIGLQSHPEVVSSMGLYTNAKLDTFISQKGRAMAAISHRPNLPYQFHIVDSPVVNAFAVPGGYVYFTRGILAHFNNTAEFAGVLGHEIGHITARHSARQQTSQILGQVGLMAGMVLSEQVRQMGEQASQVVQSLMLGYSREHETESDELGVNYSSKIGYNAKEMASFFNTLKRLSDDAGHSIPTFQSTHPDPGDRFIKVGQLAAEYQAKNPGNYATDRDSYLKMIDGIIYGDDPKQGFIENQTFYHPDLKFQFPVPLSWQTQNSPASFQMAPKDGKSMMALALGNGKTLDEAAQAKIKQYNLQVSQNKKTTINGIPALVFVATVPQQQQQGQPQTQQQGPQQPTIQLVSWFFEHNGLILNLYGVASSTELNNAAIVFQAVAAGFKPLTDTEKINRKPERIAIRTVSRNATFKEVMKGFGMADARLKELGVINQLNDNDMVKQGTLIKTIQR